MNTRPQEAQLPYNQTAIADQLLSSLLVGDKPSKPFSSKVPTPSRDEFPHWLAVIVPDSPFYLRLTVRRMTQLFTAASYGLIRGTYINQARDVEEGINWLVISWCDVESLNQGWQDVLEYATHLQKALDQECIRVIRDGSLVLVRQWS